MNLHSKKQTSFGFVSERPIKLSYHVNMNTINVLAIHTVQLRPSYPYGWEDEKPREEWENNFISLVLNY